MAPRDAALLFLMLCLIQESQAQEGYFPIPIISAQPSSMVPLNESVKILCCGTPNSYLYHLEVLENTTSKLLQKAWGFQQTAKFLIEHMNTSTAGQYQCQYRQGNRWSEHSQALELVVTGLYDKPILSTDQGLMMMPGENISLHCGSAHTPFDTLLLAREGGGNLPQRWNGGLLGNFTLGPVNLSFSGKYRCYGWYSSSPYVWSAPSDALELVVRDTMSRDYTMQNMIRMGVAMLVLVALMAIVAEEWHSHKVSHNTDLQEVPEPGLSEQETQFSSLD